MAKQQQTAPTTLPPQSESQGVGPSGDFEQIGGNAFAQEQLAAAGMGAAGMGATGGGVEQLIDWVRRLWAARVDAADTVWRVCGDGPKNWQIELVEKAIIGALLVATSEITGPLVTGIAAFPMLGKADKKIFEKFISTFVDAGVSPTVEGSIKGAVAEAKDKGEPTAPGFFHSAKAALRVESVYATDAWRDFASDITDPVIITRIDSVRAKIGDAEKIQERITTVEWMTLLAKHDTEVTDPALGTDLTKAGSGRSAQDKALGFTPRGVIHIHVHFLNSDREPEFLSSDVSGINESLLSILKASKAPLDTLDLPIMILGRVGESSSSIEIGMNEEGHGTVSTTGTGDDWLTAYAEMHGTAGADGAAAAITQTYQKKNLADINPAFKWWR